LLYKTYEDALKWKNIFDSYQRNVLQIVRLDVQGSVFEADGNLLPKDDGVSIIKKMEQARKYWNGNQNNDLPELLVNGKIIAYRIENQSIFIFEIRPEFQNPNSKIEIEVAKSTYIRTQNRWKIFWMRSDLKWHGYEPDLFVDSIEEVIEIIKSDDYACFWG
jgi:hypothetical protein